MADDASRLLAIGALALTLVAWFLAFRDLVRRDDIGNGRKTVWAVLIVLLGLVGAVLYFLFRPRGATESERSAEQQRSDAFVAEHVGHKPEDTEQP